MKAHARSLARFVSVPVLTLTLLSSFAYLTPGNRLRAVSAQSTPPSGSFGFLVNTWLAPQTNDTGTAILGLMNFDGAGNVTGPLIFQRGGTSTKAPQSVAATLSGTYSSNPDGTGVVTVTLAGALTFTFTTVMADGGQSLQLIGTDLVGGSSGGEVAGGIARAAYTGSLKGSYAFQLNTQPLPALTIGRLSFDGAGNAAMTFTSTASDPSQPPVSSGSLSGTYSVNSDGTGTIDLTPSAGGTFAMVVTDGGAGLLLMQTDGTGSNVPFGTARLQ